MEKTKFKKLLFDIACSAVACDGHIDEREIRELQYIDKSTTYFKDIDMSKTLSRFVNNFTSNPKEITNNIIRELNESLLKPIEELLVLEIVLRLVYADTKIDEREKQYIQSIRACLSLDDTMITQRFGVIDFLIQYDENNCGEISNVTFLGSREGDCNYCGAREIASRNSCSDGVCEVVGIDSCSILEGVSDSNIQLIGSSSSLDEVKSVKFLDGLDSFLEFEYDYSSSNLSYSNVEINKDSNSLIVDLSGVSITSKTIYLEDNNFVSLCVKDAFVESIDEISSECSENDEFDFSDCLDNSSGYIVDYITCTDLGDRIKIQNLSHSAVRGIPSGGSSLPITAEVIGEDSAGNVSENLEESVDGEEDDSLGEDIVDVGNENKTNYIFDINLEAVSKKNLGFWDNITFKVNVIKLIQGEAVDVIINYRLVDFNGNIVEEFNDTRRIETILEYIENFEIPLNLKKGKYKFQVGILYFDQIIDANISINVGQNFLERIFSVFDLYFGIISIVVLAFLIVLILKIHNRFKKDLIRFNGFFKNMFPFWNKSKKNIRVKR